MSMAGNDGSFPETEGCPSSCSNNEGPVLTMLNKRLRALKKKFNRISQIEENKTQGKSINKEQEEVLKSKVAVAALIDEYEKLRQPLLVALGEELAERENMAATTSQQWKEEEAHLQQESSSEGKVEESSRKEGLNGHASITQDDGVDHKPDHTYNVAPPVHVGDAQNKPSMDISSISDLLKLLYFAQLFDLRSAQLHIPSLLWTKVHERSSCLSYDFVTEDTTDPLLESDLDALCILGSLMTSRPPNARISHKDALQQCTEHALLWLQKADSPIGREGLELSYSHLRQRLERILCSEYFSMTPELQTFSQQAVVAAAAAAASATGQHLYTSPHLLIQEEDSLPSSTGPHQVEGQVVVAADDTPSVLDEGKIEQHVTSLTNQPSQDKESKESPEEQQQPSNARAVPQGPKSVQGYSNAPGGRERGYTNGQVGGVYGTGHGGKHYGQGEF